MHIPSLYLGTLNSERLWREPDISQLPAIADPQADAIVNVMDELQFVFCDSPQDGLITRMPMDSSYKDYLGTLGFSFACNQLPLIDTEVEARSRQGICELLLSVARNTDYQDLLVPPYILSPYSVEPFTEKLCQHYKLQGPNLNLEIVKKANSKIFSHQLAKQLFPTTVGEVVCSASDLQEIGYRLLQSSLFLIKDEFGVSGKGNLLIDSSQVLQRIVAYIAKQEREGKRTQFLLEPLLDKQTDFSCQFEIGATGKTQILSIQTMQNSGFAFSSIRTAELSFQEFLDRARYFDWVQAIASELYRVGYWGPVCLDSMILQSGQIVPLVEINARKSMGFINYSTDRFLSQFSTQGEMMFFSLGLSRQVTFSELLQSLEQAEILFRSDRPNGFLPLASNTFTINCARHQASPISSKAYKGRLYGSVIAEDTKQKQQILNEINHVFADLNIQKFN
ncbi:MAG: hypothetical protein ACKO24_05220 [Leptolyngbyaceae cyanobacterium]